MSLHDELVARLKAIAKVQLVAALDDPRLDFPAGDELHIFLPDLHLITAARVEEAGYPYGTNHPDLLLALVRSIAAFRSEAAPSAEIVIYQTGDLLDLWRQSDGTDPKAPVANAIQNDHADLMVALRDPALNTQFLLGNHDYDLYRFPSFDAWQRSYFIGTSALVLHGDVFDWVEKLPASLKNLALYYFSSGHQANTADLGKLRPLNQSSRRNRKFRRFIQNQAAPPTGPWRDPVGGSWNVQVAGSAPTEMLLYLDAAREKCAGTGRRLAVIGHTHHARIAVDERDGEFFALMDCGAWIENCSSTTEPEPQPNAQIGVLSGNEIRIYQLAPL